MNNVVSTSNRLCNSRAACHTSYLSRLWHNIVAFAHTVVL